MKKLLMVGLLPFIRMISVFSGLWPRSNNLWVFGSYKNSFTDNSKYLFIHVTEKNPEIRAVWITSDNAVIETIRAAGGIAFQRWSVRGVLSVLRARHWFVSAYVSDINAYLSRGATLVNLWHGVPLKKIEFDIENGPLARVFHSPTFLEKNLFYAALFRTPDYVLSTSTFVTANSFSSAFRVSRDKCLEFGYPRLDPLTWSDTEEQQWLARWGTPSMRALKAEVKRFDQIYVYMPTWRDANPNFLADAEFDFVALNHELQKKNALLILKLHPATPVGSLELVKGFSNIFSMDPYDDIYPLLSQTTALITDYSSIYIDYLMLQRPICFFIFDLEQYLSASRGFYYPYDEMTPGVKARTAREFSEFMVAGYPDQYADARATIAEKLVQPAQGNASNQIVTFFKSI